MRQSATRTDMPTAWRRSCKLFGLVAILLTLALALPSGAAAFRPTGGGLPTQTSEPTEYLSAVAFPDATHGWAVSLDGTILATANGGATWSAQWSVSTESLRAVAFPDATHGWVVGESGTILATTDGGATWSRQDSRSDAVLLGVVFPDATHGWVVGDGGTILATSDAGATWIVQRGGNSWPVLLAVAFGDVARGWAVGAGLAGGSFIFATTDGGARWNEQSSGTQAWLLGVSFIDSTHGWAVGGVDGGGTIVSTTDGGATWSVQRTGMDAILRAVDFSSETHGWAVGGDHLDPVTNTYGSTILATTNGGATWRPQSAASSRGLSGVAFSDATHGWAVGDVILATTDGGATWHKQYGIIEPQVSKLRPASGRRGAIVRITGSAFGTKRGTGSVKFGTTACPRYVSWGDTKITCKVPAAARYGSVKVTVTTSAGKSNAKSFTVKR